MAGKHASGILVMIICILVIGNIPVKIARATIFKDTICVAIMYKDSHEDAKYVQKDEYKRWLSYKDKLTTKFEGTIDSSEISATVECYSTFTGTD